MKTKIIAIAWTVALLALSACSSSSSGTAPAPVTSITGVVVSGSAVKGPYQPGSTVKVYTLTKGVRSTSPVATGEVTDVIGNYSVTIPPTATGPFEVVIVGSYVDETTGAISTSTQETSLVIADTANIPAKLNVNPIASTQAAIVKKALANSTKTNVDVAQEIKAAGVLALQALGIPTTDVNGNAVDPVQIDIFDSTADPAVIAAAITASAMIAEVVNSSNGAVTVASFAAGAATDVSAGQPLGTTDNLGTQIVAAVAANVGVDFVGNITTGVAAAAATAGTPAPTATVATTTGDLTTAGTTAATVTTLKGFALAGNILTIGGVGASVAATGVATAAITGVGKNNVVVVMTVKDYGTGTAAKNQTINTSFDFYIADTASTRAISGTVSPVMMIADGAGTVSLKVPVGATLTFTGTTAAGTVVTGTANNAAINTVFSTTVAGVTTINANTLLTQIQKKVNNTALNVLNIAGTFDFAFGIGVNFGFENGTANGISSLFPTTNTKVSGRAISGTITTN